MYDLYAISTGDLSAVISSIAAVGVLLGMLFGWILSYVLRIEGRISTLEEAVSELKAKKE